MAEAVAPTSPVSPNPGLKSSQWGILTGFTVTTGDMAKRTKSVLCLRPE